jgi:hypothetical protein
MILTVGLVLAMQSLAAAAVTVDNVSLKKQGEFTEITVYTSGSAEFTHEIVEPGGGKPYRVVLDLKDAVHNLPHYNFNGLPSETITSIRTSQYSVAPDKVFRLVADVKGNVTYKIKHDDYSVTIAVATPSDKEFPFWCAQPLSEANKLQLALESKPSSDGAAKQPVVKPAVEKAEPAVGKSQESPDKGEQIPTLVSSRVSGDPASGPRVPVVTESAPKQGIAEVQAEQASVKTSEKSVSPPGPSASPETIVAHTATPTASNVSEQILPAPVEKQQVAKPVNQKTYEKMPLATAAFRDTGSEVEPQATVTEPAVQTKESTQSDSRGSVVPLAALPAVPERQPESVQQPIVNKNANVGASSSDQTVSNAAPESDLKQAPAQPQTATELAEKNPAAGETVPETKSPSAQGQAQRNVLGDTSAGVGAPRAPGDDSASGEGESPMQKPPALPEGAKDEDIYRMNPDSPTKTTGTLADRFPKRSIVEYESWEKPDPFMPLIDQPLGGQGAGSETPDVESLRLVGVLEGEHGSSALFEDLEGYGYILKDGDPVKNGYVVQITDDRVVFQIEEYGWSRTIALRMETGQ